MKHSKISQETRDALSALMVATRRKAGPNELDMLRAQYRASQAEDYLRHHLADMTPRQISACLQRLIDVIPTLGVEGYESTEDGS